MLLRFYYFSFVYFYKSKPENWEGWFRSVLLVELTIFGSLMLVKQLVNRFITELPPINQVLLLIINIAILGILYQILAARGKSQITYSEFLSHPWNTKINRMMCWLIWILSLILPMILAVYIQYKP